MIFLFCHNLYLLNHFLISYIVNTSLTRNAPIPMPITMPIPMQTRSNLTIFLNGACTILSHVLIGSSSILFLFILYNTVLVDNSTQLEQFPGFDKKSVQATVITMKSIVYKFAEIIFVHNIFSLTF